MTDGRQADQGTPFHVFSREAASRRRYWGTTALGRLARPNAIISRMSAERQ